MSLRAASIVTMDVMTADMLDALDRRAINDLLLEGGRWPFGPFLHLDRNQIGSEYGFSGRTYRLSGATSSAGRRAVVAKVESGAGIARAAAFRASSEAQLVGSIPASYGWRIGSDAGLIVLEDVSPADQGDDLASCTLEQATAMIDVVAHVHSLSWLQAANAAPSGIERWKPSAWERDRWEDRLGRATRRYPDHLTSEVRDRLADFNEVAFAAAEQMAVGPVTWIHQDPHLDNILWRPDDSPVLLDWSGAVIGPPSVDLAVLMMSLALDERSPLQPEEAIATYSGALQRRGAPVSETVVAEMAAFGLRHLLRGLIGWAGFPGEDPQDRRLPCVTTR